MRITIIAVGALALGLGGAAVAESVGTFDRAGFEASFNAAFQNKDATAVGEHLASIYNEGGVSKQEFVRQLGELFKKADVKVDYSVSDFHQIPGTNVGYVKIAAKMSTRPVPQLAQSGQPKALPVGNNAEKVVRTAGYATVVYENSAWRLVASTPADCGTTAVVIEGVGWGSQVNPAAFSAALLSVSNRPVFQETANKHVFEAPQGNLPAFDQKEWETRFRNAWNSKNLPQIMSFYSERFADLGMDRSQIEEGFKNILAEYDQIKCDYKVVGVKFLEGAPIASIKAVLDLRGTKKGALVPILQTGGTASLVVEHGQWTTYAVQPLQTNDVGEKAYQLARNSSDTQAAVVKHVVLKH